MIREVMKCMSYPQRRFRAASGQFNGNITAREHSEKIFPVALEGNCFFLAPFAVKLAVRAMARRDHWIKPQGQPGARVHGILPRAVSRMLAHLELRTVPTSLQGIPAVVLLLAATILEVSGDAVVRTALYNHVGLPRAVLFFTGAALLLGYGTLLNWAPLEFGQVVGLYLATLFVVWQVVNFVAFRILPTLPIVLGGSLVIAGGAIITFWKPG
jgi:hypothetical protein